MRDFELDDRFWRDALSVLRSGRRSNALADRYPEYAALLDELARDAAGEPVLIGFRHAAADENPRLLALLSAAFLARAGRRTLLLDLDPEVRWLEQILGADFKEGVVDHLQFGVPLERCVRSTALAGLEAMSGGAAFLAGSPLDDPPRFRASLLSLKDGRDAVVVVLPPPAGSADGAGVPALCDAVVTIEDTEGPSEPLGTERGYVRLSGDPRAARELARLCHRFVGPLPALLGPAESVPGPAVRSLETAADARSEPFWAVAGAGRAGSAAPRATGSPVVDRAGSASGQGRGASPESEELDFLSAFEGGRTGEPPVVEARNRLDELVEASRARGQERRKARAGTGPRRPLDRRALTLATVILAAIAALALGSRWFAPLFAGWTGGRIAERESGPAAAQGSAEPGTVIPLAGPGQLDADSIAAAQSEDVDSAPATPAPAPGRPAPYSVHVGSYRTADAARGVVRGLRQRGMDAFMSPVVLPEKGEWVRVYVGAFDDAAAARAELEKLTSGGVVEDGTVRDTPLAFLLGVYGTSEEAERHIAELASRGIPAYALGDGPVRVWAGAFENEEESRVLASALDAETLAETVALSRRER
jgi:cell division septation protein DedD